MSDFSRISSAERAGSGFTSQRRRNEMVATVRAKGIRNPEVIDVMRTVPRHLFIDEALAGYSYEDTPLGIGFKQTISQPYIVAKMTTLLIEHDCGDGPPRKVLEIGTGSGYQAGVLSLLVDRVVTVERIEELHRRSRATLLNLGYTNVSCHLAKPRQWGWPASAPYDAIMITAATEMIPNQLFEQLRPGGIIIAPVGPQDEDKTQRLQVHYLDPAGSGERRVRQLEAVRFVPLIQ